MKKNKMDQNGGPGRFETASGYTTNARPAPVERAKGYNPLPDNKILDRYKLKQIADDISKCI